MKKFTFKKRPARVTNELLENKIQIKKTTLKRDKNIRKVNGEWK